MDGWTRFGRLRLALAVALMLGAAPAAASEAEYAALCERAIAHGARTVGIPVEVLHAVALTETGRRLGSRLQPWPWAINREGQGFWFKTRDEALGFARQSVAEGRHSFDMSCFQINYHWHGRAFPSLEAMIDPDTAAVYAARFLRDLHAELGTWSAAAGAYHSRTPEYAQRYRARFDRILASLGGGPALAEGFVAATAPPEPETVRLPVPTRQLAGPKIITLTPADAGGAVVQAPRPGEGRVVVTIDAPLAPLPAGTRL